MSALKRLADILRPGRVRKGFQAESISPKSAAFYLAAFVPAVFLVVYANSEWNVIVNDTLLLVSSFEMLERFSSLFSSANSNPLQALFDIFPSGLRLDTIPNLLGTALFGPGPNMDFYYAFTGVLLCLAVVFMARTVGFDWGVATFSGILLPFLILPTFGMFPLMEHMYLLWPIFYYAAAGTVLVCALYWRIDGRSLTRTGLQLALIIAILGHLAVVQGLFMTLMAPALAAMGLGALAASSSRREFLAKVVCALAIPAVLLAAGIFHYIHALGVTSATYVFHQELASFMLLGSPNWDIFLWDMSHVFYNPFQHSVWATKNVDGLVAPLAQIGALTLAVFGQKRQTRIFGITMVLWVIATGIAISIIHFFHYYTGYIYHGPDPRHFVRILWPFYIIFFTYSIFVATGLIVKLVSRAWPRAVMAKSYVPHAFIALVLALPVSFLLLNSYLEKNAPEHAFEPQIFYSGVPPYSPRKNGLIDHLEANISISPDSKFRGSAVHVPTQFHKDLETYGPSHREGTFIYLRSYLGSDMGAFDLRLNNIPTLDQMTHNVKPQYYLLSRELLSRPGIDRFDRHFATPTRLNEPILKMLGTRYIIADYELPIGRQVYTLPIPQDVAAILEGQKLLKPPLRLFELSDANVGDYSPTNVVRAENAEAMIIEMSRPDFDGRTILVAEDFPPGERLVQATDAVMTVRKGGVGIRASSTGTSVLVLPVQYSHCWEIVSGGGDASLFRANLMLLGVRFTGELNLELRQYFGPFWQFSCRVADAADARRLDFVGAMGSGTALNKIKGDGINLVPRPEQLESVVPGSASASLRRAEGAATALSQYVLTAENGKGEHYVTLQLPDTEPGTYTLSMQVWSQSPADLVLQLHDGANGALGHYRLPESVAEVARLGTGGESEARIRRVDEEWKQITLTTSLPKGTGLVVLLQLADRRTGRWFDPDGHSAIVRAVKLERGEVATPYIPNATPSLR